MPILDSNTMGLLTISGPRAASNAMLVYTLLKKVNETQRKIIFLLERKLTYLMSHADSIVIQAELADDVPSMSAGIENDTA